MKYGAFLRCMFVTLHSQEAAVRDKRHHVMCGAVRGADLAVLLPCALKQRNLLN